jgi:FkbM family methyltransferase
MHIFERSRSTILNGLRSTGLDSPIFSVWQRVNRLTAPKRSLKFHRQFFQPGDLVFDVGANIGDRTKIYLELGAKVVAVEPQQGCMDKLQTLFKGDARVHLVNQGLSDRPGTMEISICEDDTAISTMSERRKTEGRFSNRNWSKKQTIKLTTLDALITEFGRPVFCKIDVEGFEELVLKGLTQPLPCVSFEYTCEFLDEAKKCINHLLSLGTPRFNFSRSESMKLYYREWLTASELLRNLENMNDGFLFGDIYARF